MKITIDTNVLISSTMWDNSVAFKLLKKLIENDDEIFTTAEILDEYKKKIFYRWQRKLLCKGNSN